MLGLPAFIVWEQKNSFVEQLWRKRNDSCYTVSQEALKRCCTGALGIVSYTLIEHGFRKRLEDILMKKLRTRTLQFLLIIGLLLCASWLCACGQKQDLSEPFAPVAPEDVSMEDIPSEVGSARYFDGRGCVDENGNALDDWKVKITVNKIYRSEKKLSELPAENIRYDVWSEIDAGQLTDQEMHVREDKTEGIEEKQVPMKLFFVDETIENVGDVPVRGVSIVGSMAPIDPKTREFIPKASYQNARPEDVYINAYGKNDTSEHNNTAGYRPGMIYITELQPGESANVLVGYAIPDAALDFPMGILHTGFGDDSSYQLEKVVIIGYVE